MGLTELLVYKKTAPEGGFGADDEIRTRDPHLGNFEILVHQGFSCSPRVTNREFCVRRVLPVLHFHPVIWNLCDIL